jgi:hypothetical protein
MAAGSNPRIVGWLLLVMDVEFAVKVSWELAIRGKENKTPSSTEPNNHGLENGSGKNPLFL